MGVSRFRWFCVSWQLMICPERGQVGTLDKLSGENPLEAKNARMWETEVRVVLSRAATASTAR